MGRLSLKPLLCVHIPDINKISTNLKNFIYNQKYYTRRAKNHKVCEDCGGIEAAEETASQTCSNDITQSKTNFLGIKSALENVVQDVVKSVAQPGQKISQENNIEEEVKEGETVLKNDVTTNFDCGEAADCGCKEADKQRQMNEIANYPAPEQSLEVKVDVPETKKPCNVNDALIKVEIPCLKLNAESKIVLDKGIVGIHDCKLTKRKYNIIKFIWKNKANNTEIEAITLGATVTKMILPDRNGLLKDVLLGFDNHEDYVNKGNYYLGSTIGRSTNMISNPVFQYDGVCSNLSINRMKKHHFNGGVSGFNKYVWSPYVCGNKVIFSHLSKDGSEGYPGDMLTTVSMELTKKNKFEIDIQASSTDPTICNISNRLLFNLSSHAGGGSQLRRHIMHVNADGYIGYDERGLPVCSPRKTRGSEFDATCPTSIHEILKKWPNKDFRSAYVLNRATKQDVCMAARFIHEVSGRSLEVHTNQPIVNIDFGYDLPRSNEPVDKRLIGKCKVRYINNSSVCVQPQGYPDAINQKDFPTPVLLPGDIYHNKIIYEFGIVDKPTYEPLKTMEICLKVPSPPHCCNKLEGDTVDFTCEKDLYEQDPKENYIPPKPKKPCN